MIYSCIKQSIHQHATIIACATDYDPRNYKDRVLGEKTNIKYKRCIEVAHLSNQNQLKTSTSCTQTYESCSW